MTSPQSKADTQSEITALAQELVQRVIALRPGQRYILGITGYPGAGKSTVSEWIVDAVNQQLRKHAAGGDMEAMLVPMDGYHLSNERLTELNLLPLKGIPDTFDAEAFVDLLRRLRTVTGENVYAPLFDRSIEASIQ
ncbi:MAG TPA: hypothetical protein V6C69_16025, partial [Trichormus sp.]